MSRSAHLVLVGSGVQGPQPRPTPDSSERRARARAMARHPSSARSDHGPGTPPMGTERRVPRHLVVVRSER